MISCWSKFYNYLLITWRFYAHVCLYVVSVVLQGDRGEKGNEEERDEENNNKEKVMPNT